MGLSRWRGQHLITFGGNPTSCAAALANLEIMKNENMTQRSDQMGDYLYERLQTLRKHPIVGDVRGGKSLLCALELVKDRDSKARFPKEAKIDRLAVEAMREHRMLGRAGHIIPIALPLCITREEIDEAVGRLDDVVGSLGEQVSVT